MVKPTTGIDTLARLRDLIGTRTPVIVVPGPSVSGIRPVVHALRGLPLVWCGIPKWWYVERELLAFVRFPIEQLQTPTEIREAKAQAVETLAALNRLLELLRAGHDKAALTTPAEAFCSPERIARLELLAEELDFVRETLAEGIEPELLRRVAELRVCPDA